MTLQRKKSRPFSRVYDAEGVKVARLRPDRTQEGQKMAKNGPKIAIQPNFLTYTQLLPHILLLSRASPTRALGLWVFREENLTNFPEISRQYEGLEVETISRNMTLCWEKCTAGTSRAVRPHSVRRARRAATCRARKNDCLKKFCVYSVHPTRVCVYAARSLRD